jgi:type I restriction enzyme S subunit
MVPAGTVLYTSRAPIGYVAIAERSVCTNQGFRSLVPPPEIGSDYLYWYMHYATAEVRTRASGTTFAEISGKAIKAVPLRLAPAAEQERIVAAIEEQFSRLDAAMEALERVRQNLERMRAAVLQAAVSPTALGTDAQAVALGDLVTAGRKAAYGVLVPGDDVPDGVPFVRVGDLGERSVRVPGLKRIADTVAARYPRTHLHGGEVLLSLVGTIGRVAVVPPSLAGANVARAIAVIPLREGVDPAYVAIALSSNRVTNDLIELSHEVARKTLNLEDVRRYKIPVPSYERQLALVNQVERAETWIRTAENAVAVAQRQAEHLRSSILAAAFCGKLVSQDPNDEPASGLFEHIAAERVSSNGHKPAKAHRQRRRKVTT